MVKESILVASEADMENPSEWMDRLRDALLQVPFVRIHQIALSPVMQNGLEADAELQLQIQKESWAILVEISKNGEPQRVRMAAEQLRRAVQNHPGKVYGVLMAPFLSNASREILKNAGLGWLDWAGNSFLSFSGIHIEMERSQINPFKTRRQQISLFAPKSAQLLRLFLTQPGPWKVEAMAKKGGVSLGQVSKVRKLLLEKEYGAIDPAGGLVLKNGHALLDMACGGQTSSGANACIYRAAWACVGNEVGRVVWSQNRAWALCLGFPFGGAPHRSLRTDEWGNVLRGSGRACYPQKNIGFVSCRPRREHHHL